MALVGPAQAFMSQYGPRVAGFVGRYGARQLFRQGVGAARAGAGVYGAYRQARRMLGSRTTGRRAPAQAASTRAVSAGGNGGGGYSGPFRKARGRKRPRGRAGRYAGRLKGKKSQSKGENFYARYGAISTIEVSGVVTDPDCVYVGHASHAPTETLRVCVYALVRRLYHDAIGYEADNMKSVIPYTSGATQGSAGHTIVVKWNTPTGVKAQGLYVIGAGETIVSVGDILYNDIFQPYSQQTDTWKERQLLWIEVLDTATGMTRAHLDLTAVYVDIYTKAEMKVQNCTIPVAGATTEDNVANVPLVGRLYEFKTPQPIVSDDDMKAFDWLNQDTGVITYRAGQVAGIQYETWKEPPPSKAFVNCSGMTKARLEPGHIKSSTLVTKSKMLFSAFMEKLAIKFSISGNYKNKIGSCQVLGLERLLQKAGDLPLQLNYEVNTFTGVSVTHKNRRAIMQKITYSTQNNP